MDPILYSVFLTGSTGFTGYLPGFPDESLETPIAFGDKSKASKY
jgi:hypothetical protein